MNYLGIGKYKDWELYFIFLEKLEGWSETEPIFINCTCICGAWFHFGINYCLAFVGICSLRLSCYSSKSHGNLKIYSNIKTKAVVLKVSYYFDFLYIWKCLTYLRFLLIHLDLVVSFISVREVQSWTSPSLISGCKMVSLFCTRLASIRLSYLFPLPQDVTPASFGNRDFFLLVACL